jgi:hypothetical protein
MGRGGGKERRTGHIGCLCKDCGKEEHAGRKVKREEGDVK